MLFSDCTQDVDLSYKKFLDKIIKLLDIHAPVKKLSHKEINSLSKPWLTKSIHKAEICIIQKVH